MLPHTKFLLSVPEPQPPHQFSQVSLEERTALNVLYDTTTMVLVAEPHE